MDSTNSNISWPFVFSTIGLASLYFFPQFRILITYDQLAYISAFYYVCFISKTVPIKHIVRLMTYSIPFCLLMYVAKSFNFKYGFMLNFMTLWNLLIPSLLCVGIMSRNRRKELLIITWSTVAMIVATCLITLTEMTMTENVMRELTAGTTDEIYAFELRKKGVGGFGVAYAMGAFAVGLYVLGKQIPKKKKIWWLITALLLFVCYFVTQAQFTTLLLITIVSIAFYYYFIANTNNQKIAVIGCTVAIWILLPYLFQLLISLYSNTTIGARLDRMYVSLWGSGDLTEVSGSRSLQQIDAFMLFLQSPLWGNNITGTTNAYIHLACHSTILAVAAATGLIGVWSYLKSFKTAFAYQLDEILSHSAKSIYYPVVLYYLLFAIFNPIDGFPEASWIIYVVIPSLYKLYSVNN